MSRRSAQKSPQVKTARERAVVPVWLPVSVAGTAAVVMALASGMTAHSEARLDMDRTVEAIAEAAGGSYGTQGLAGVMARLDGAQLAVAMRHDPAMGPEPMLLGLTPGWESLRLSGKPDPFATVNGLEALKLNAGQAGDAFVMAAPPFAFRPAADADRQRALRCLTQAVYYEAALESDQGQAAVAQVVLNRVRDPNYPNTVCGVVYQGAERNTGCQFTFTCDGALARPPLGWAWSRAQKVAERALAGAVEPRVGSATHYHADYVRPWWAPSLSKVSQIGAHIFYRWKGSAGSVGSLSQTYAGREPVINEALFARPRELMVAQEVVTESAEEAELSRLVGNGNREVEFDGTKRIVGAPSLGGRRQASAKEISDINERLKALEEGRSMPASGREVP